MYSICLKVISLLSIMAVVTCDDKDKSTAKNQSSFKEWTISLDNRLGNISISLPGNMDTFFKWTQYTDCGDPCAQTDYRVQSKSLPIFKESGFYFEVLKDSVEQFTIKHTKTATANVTPDTLVVNHFIGKLKSETVENIAGKYLIDTLITINDKPFAVLAYTVTDTANRITIQKLTAITAIQGNGIEFYFECRKKYMDSDSVNFIRNSYAALKTVLIANQK